jgi:hypothetical protein
VLLLEPLRLLGLLHLLLELLLLLILLLEPLRLLFAAVTFAIFLMFVVKIHYNFRSFFLLDKPVT